MDIESYRDIQNIALTALRDIRPFIRAGVTEKEIVQECTRLLEAAGISEWWYHKLPALVLVGKRTPLSMSGKDYAPSDVAVRALDLVTIDVGPERDGCWGDCARSYVVEDGTVNDSIKNPALADGIHVEKLLHSAMRDFATHEVTMHDLYAHMNAKITEFGYENLDFKGNLGHSIEKHMDKRRYIESGNVTRLGEVSLFTFEPHIRKKGGAWGFKRENIYYFESGKAVPLGMPELLEAI